jgi:predicted DsbA family dithiol-disulfide isomerase
MIVDAAGVEINAILEPLIHQGTVIVGAQPYGVFESRIRELLDSR